MSNSQQAAGAISMRDVHLSLGRGAARVHILKGISLEIGEGEAIGLVGPSGSGKSTLLMTMAGLERPDSGQMHIRHGDMACGSWHFPVFRRDTE